MPRLFPCAARSELAGRPLRRDAPGSFFLVVSPLQSSFVSTPAQGLSTMGVPAKVSSLIAARLATSTHTRTAKSSLRSVLRLSQPLDGLLRHPAPRAYSIPQPRPGFITVQGLLPSRSRTFLVERPFPHVVVVVALTTRRLLPRSDAATSRHSSARRSVSQGW